MDVDRLTTFVYDGAGHLTKQVAHNANGAGGENRQVTEYVYGVDVPKGSLLDTNDLLYRVKYPDEGSGNSGSTSEYWVTHTYNRQGELLSTEDHNGTEHAFTRDASGRVTRDDAMIDPASGIDDAVRAITYTYDNHGRQELISSRDSLDAVLNQVKFEYSSAGEITSVWQEPGGAVGAGSPRVQHNWSTQTVDGLAFRRHDSLVYPDGAAVNSHYGAASGSPDARIARLTGLSIGAPGSSPNLVEYDHVGASLVAIADYVLPDVKLDRSVKSNGENIAGGYPGWDSFGRVVRQHWADGNFGPTVPPTTNPAIPSIVEFAYAYDMRGNITQRRDEQPTRVWPFRDEQHSYDELHRLTEAARGTSGASFTYHAKSQKWSLDMLGNMDSVFSNADTGGAYQTEETREHNEANELDSRDPDGSGGNPDLDLDFDDAGNIISQALSTSTTVYYTHDAWNRLVETTWNSDTRATYTYNGLHWRIEKTADVHGATISDPPDGTLDERRLYFYTDGWQLVESHVDSDLNQTVDEIEQYFWGAGGRGSDDIIMQRDRAAAGSWGSGAAGGSFHLTDIQQSTVALIDDVATVLERASYDPHGRPRWYKDEDLNGDGVVNTLDLIVMLGAWGGFGPGDLNRDGTVNVLDQIILLGAYGAGGVDGELSSPGLGNIFGLAGYTYDAEAQMYHVRLRYYEPVLGRWLQRDAAGYVDGMSLYLYAMANPMVFVDPLGLFGDSPFSKAWDFITDPVFNDTVANYMAFNAPPAVRNLYFESMRIQHAMRDTLFSSSAQAGANTAQAIANIPSDMYNAWRTTSSPGVLLDLCDLDLPEAERFSFANDAFVQGAMANQASEFLIQFGLMGLVPAPKGAGAGGLIDDIAKSSAVVADDAAKLTATSRPSSRALARSLEEAGHTRPAEAATHHIVAGRARGAADGRRILADFGVDINDAANGVFLPATRASVNPTGAAVHSTVHTREYYRAVNTALEQARSRQQVMDVLATIRQVLLSGGMR